MFWFFSHEACGVLAPRPGVEPTRPALEGEVLTTGPPGKSLHGYWLIKRAEHCHVKSGNGFFPITTFKFFLWMSLSYWFGSIVERYWHSPFTFRFYKIWYNLHFYKLILHSISNVIHLRNSGWIWNSLHLQYGGETQSVLLLSWLPTLPSLRLFWGRGRERECGCLEQMGQRTLFSLGVPRPSPLAFECHWVGGIIFYRGLRVGSSELPFPLPHTHSAALDFWSHALHRASLVCSRKPSRAYSKMTWAYTLSDQGKSHVSSPCQILQSTAPKNGITHLWLSFHKRENPRIDAQPWGTSSSLFNLTPLWQETCGRQLSTGIQPAERYKSSLSQTTLYLQEPTAWIKAWGVQGGKAKCHSALHSSGFPSKKWLLLLSTETLLFSLIDYVWGAVI